MARTKVTGWGTLDKRDRGFALWLGGKSMMTPDEIIESVQRCVKSGWIRLGNGNRWHEPKAKTPKQIADQLGFCTQDTVRKLIAFAPPAAPLTLPEVGNIERELAEAEAVFGDLE
jgi:hypothetical protein